LDGLDSLGELVFIFGWRGVQKLIEIESEKKVIGVEKIISS
jgi:hypothetical protein